MIACLRVPYFATLIDARDSGRESDRPFALISYDEAQPNVASISASAEAHGLRPGMSLRAALTLCPDLDSHPFDRARFRREIDGLMATLSAFSNRIEADSGLALRSDSRRKAAYYLSPAQVDPQSAAICYIDLGRITLEESFERAQVLRQALLDRGGLPLALGMAAGRFAARLAATSLNPDEALVIRPGRDGEFLAPYPTAALPVDQETLRQLDLLGLHSLGQIAALPRAALSDRFGRQGTLLSQLAQGEEKGVIALYVPRRSETLIQDVEGWPADRRQLESLLFQMASELAARLAAAGCAADLIDLRVEDEEGQWLGESLALRSPSSGAARLADAAFDLLLTLPIRRHLQTLELRFSGAAPVFERQLSLFDRPPVAIDQLRAALASLSGRYGDCFYVARLVDPDARIPEARFRLEPAKHEPPL